MSLYLKTIAFENYRYVSGETVYLTVYNPSGIKVLNSIPMSEVGSRGIYKHTYSTSTEGNHLAIFTNGSFKRYNMIKIGNSRAQRIYIQGNRFKSNLTNIKIYIYKPSGALVVDGEVMTELDETGIYYYDYSISDEGSHICYIEDLTEKIKELLIIDYFASLYTPQCNIHNLHLDEESLNLKLNDREERLRLIRKNATLKINEKITSLRCEEDKIRLVV